MLHAVIKQGKVPAEKFPFLGEFTVFVKSEDCLVVHFGMRQSRNGIFLIFSYFLLP